MSDTPLQSIIAFDRFKIIKVVSTSTPACSASNLAERIVNHGLDFAPIIFSFIKIDSKYVVLPVYTTYSLAGASIAFTSWVDTAADSDNIYIDIICASGVTAADGLYPIKVYLCRETAQ